MKKKTSLSFFCGSDKGNKRKLNEDSFLVDEQLGVWVLADGMGGYESGDVASQIATQHIIECCKNEGLSLVEAVYSAHHAILNAAKNGIGQWGMGTTIVALKITGFDYEITWVGDSRAYLLGAGKIIQITKDHSLVQEMIDSGHISQEEAQNHPKRNVISQALGSPEMDEIKVDVMTGKLSFGETIMLCSDGLTTEVNDTQIANIVQQDLSTEAKVNHLIGAALNAGGKDNVTVILVERKPDSGLFLSAQLFFKKIKNYIVKA